MSTVSIEQRLWMLQVRQMDFLTDSIFFPTRQSIHISLPFVSEIVQRAPLLISGFFQALGGKHGLDLVSRMNLFFLPR
jgi:hypothetical protein